MTDFTDLQADALSVQGFANGNALIPTRYGGNKKSWQYLVDQFEAEFAEQLLEINKSRGYRVAGTFAAGFDYELFNDVGVDASGNSWIYVGAGAPVKTVTAGTVPSAPDYQQVTYNSIDGVIGLRDELNDRVLYLTLAEAQAKTDLVVGQYVRLTDRDMGLCKLLPVGVTATGWGTISAANGVLEVQLENKVAVVTHFGAKGDDVQDDTPPIKEAIDRIEASGGGRVHFPSADSAYWVHTNDDDKACLWVNSNYITLSGDGASSVVKTKVNSHVPIHFSSTESLSTIANDAQLTDFEVYGLCVRGTGVYENFGLAKGRGILFRNVKNVNIHDNLVQSMSMIGICAEGGDGYFRCQNNQVHSCRYTGVNYNGRCYQSIISGNIISKCNAEPNSLAIQATGHSIISSNTVYGEVGNAANCGGIMWGEGNYDGIGIITGNLVKHTSFGIQAIYHGSCNIIGNTVINALTRDGILMSGTSTASFTVGNSDNICSDNLIINSGSNGINCSASGTIISGNKIRNFTPITNPSASTEPDYIVGVATAQGIRIRAADCMVHGNQVSGCTHGLTTTILQRNGVIGKNTLINNTYDYSLESETSGVFAAFGHAIVERELASSELYRERIFRANLPTQGFFKSGSKWDDPTPSIGSPFGQVVLFSDGDQTVAVQSNAGSSVVSVTSSVNMSGTGTGSIIGFELDNGSWHWAALVSKSGNDLTIGASIPVGRSVQVGASVAYSYFRPLANIT